MAGPMYRPPARRIALSSSLALLLGAGMPLEQAVAQSAADRSVGRSDASPWNLESRDNDSGFEMLPAAPAPAAPKPAQATTTVNGFELLPETAGASGANATAQTTPAVQAGAPNASGFVLLPAAEPAAPAVAAPPAPSPAAAVTAPRVAAPALRPAAQAAPVRPEAPRVAAP